MAQRGFFEDKCRCCLQNGTLKNMWDEHCGKEGEEIYGEMMNKCFAISWQKHEVEIEKICESCVNRLRDAVDFKKMVLTSEQHLLEYEDLNEETENTIEQPIESDIVVTYVETTETQDNIYMDVEYLEETDPTTTKPSENENPTMCIEDIITKLVPVPGSAVHGDILIGKTNDGGTKTSKNKQNSGKYNDVSSDSDELSDDDENESEPDIPQTQSIGEREKLQHNLKAILLCSNATPLKAPTDRGYGCEFCNKEFLEPTHLKRHILSTHGDDVKSRYMKEVEMHLFFVRLDITALYCKYCFENIDTIESLLEHLKTVHSEKVYTDIVRLFIPFKFQDSDAKCCQCDRRFQSFRALSRHMATHYRNYQCKTCCKWYMTRMSLRRHRQLHDTGVFPCSKCPKIFDNKVLRRQHERGHFGKKKFKSPCGICNERFSDYQVKLKHLTDVHGITISSISQTHLCNACPKKFTNTRNLIHHMRTVHSKLADYKCHICEKEYKEKGLLKNHIVWHQNKTPFACQICNKRYHYENSLTNHIQKVHQNNRSTRFDEFIHTCDFCQRKFSRRKTMLRHMRTAHNFCDVKNIQITAT